MTRKTSVSENRRQAQKEAAKKRPQTWKKGDPSPNPKGAPKRGESWGELIKLYGDMTPAEAAQHSLELTKKLLDIGEGVTLKEAVVLRVYAALLFEPDAKLLNAFMDRAEGKVALPVELSWRERAKKEHGYTDEQLDKLVAEFSAAMVTRRHSE